MTSTTARSTADRLSQCGLRLPLAPGGVPWSGSDEARRALPNVIGCVDWDPAEARFTPAINHGSAVQPYNAMQTRPEDGMEQQPPRFSEAGGEPAEEQFPAFDPVFSQEPPLPLQRASGGPPRAGGGGQANPFLIGLAVAVVLGAISIIAFGLFAPEDEASPGTTLADGGTTLTTTAPTDDTSVPTTGDTTETTAGSDPTGTTVTLPGDDDLTIEPSGDPIPVSSLTMSSNDIGPLDFGDPAIEVLGSLAATFGDPTEDTGFLVGNGTWGECPGDTIRIVRWGPLAVVFEGEQRVSILVSYRLDLKYGGITSETTDIATLSGLRVGDTVGDLQRIYAGFVVEYVVDPDVGLVFELRGERGGELLLWGPVESQNSDALVTGIYSPDSCEEE